MEYFPDLSMFQFYICQAIDSMFVYLSRKVATINKFIIRCFV